MSQQNSSPKNFKKCVEDLYKQNEESEATFHHTSDYLQRVEKIMEDAVAKPGNASPSQTDGTPDEAGDRIISPRQIGSETKSADSESPTRSVKEEKSVPKLKLHLSGDNTQDKQYARLLERDMKTGLLPQVVHELTSSATSTGENWNKTRQFETDKAKIIKNDTSDEEFGVFAKGAVIH